MRVHLDSLDVVEVQVTHFSDPGCPWAYSGPGAHAVLRWRYGAQLQVAASSPSGWTAKDAEQYIRRGYSPAGSAPRLRDLPPPRHAVRRRSSRPRVHRDRQCVPGDRGRPACKAPEAQHAVFRALQFRLVHDAAGDGGPRRPRVVALVAGVEGSTSTSIVGALSVGHEVEAAYQAGPRRGAHRRGLRRPRLQGKAARTGRPQGPLHGAVADLRARGLGGSRPAASRHIERPTTSCFANLAPQLERTPPPQDPLEALEAFEYGLTTYEVAAVMNHDKNEPDPESAELALIEHVAEGRVIRESLGDGRCGAFLRRKAVRVERPEAKRRAAPRDRRGDQPPVIGPSPTPAPSWPVATQKPVRERPMAGSPSGSQGRRPAHAAFISQRPDRRHQPGRRPSSRAVTAGSTPCRTPALPARPDEHLAVERRLDHGRDLQLGLRGRPPRRGSRRRPPCGGTARRAARRSRTSWPLRGSSGRSSPALRGELRAPGSGGEDDLVGAQLRQTDPHAHPGRQGRVTGVGAKCRCSSAIARAIARGSHWRSPRHPGRAKQGRPASGSSARAWPGSSSSHSTPAARRRSIRAGSAARPGLGAVDDQRTLAPDPRPLAVGGPRSRRRRRARAPRGRAPGPASLSEHSTLPSPSPVVPPETSPASTSSTSTPRRASARAVAAPTMPAPTTDDAALRS